jgi:hypothetical protein
VQWSKEKKKTKGQNNNPNNTTSNIKDWATWTPYEKWCWIPVLRKSKKGSFSISHDRPVLFTYPGAKSCLAK